MTPFYLMESKAESERLRIKSNHEKTFEQLLETGLGNIAAGSHIIDAGSGIGHVAEVMADVLDEHSNHSTITLLDQSDSRLIDARRRIDNRADFHYVSCDLAAIPLESHCADYVFCRFVFEYLSNPRDVFNELTRLVKPGGKLVIGDLDYNCMTHYPLDADLESSLSEVIKTLQMNNFFDPYMGRKLYSYFHESGLKDIRVHLYAHHLFYGNLSAADEFNWMAKLDQLIELQKNGTIRLDVDLERFCRKFHDFLKSPGRFSYTPLILVEGTRPHE